MKKKIDHDFGSVLNGGFWVKFGGKSTKKLEQKAPVFLNGKIYIIFDHNALLSI